MIDENIAELENSVHILFRNLQFSSLVKKRTGLLHVTDIVRECGRHTVYNKLKIHSNRNMDINSLSNFFSGEAVHQMLDRISPKVDNVSGETIVKYNFIDDKDVNYEEAKKITDVKEWLKILVGEYDAIYNIDGRKVLVDYKTWKSNGFPLKAMKSDHLIQLSIYKYLIHKEFAEDIDYGAIIYLDFEDKFEKPKVLVKKLMPLDEVEKMLKLRYEEMLHTLNTGELPLRVQSWYCNYCPYASRCFTEDTIPENEREYNVIV